MLWNTVPATRVMDLVFDHALNLVEQADADEGLTSEQFARALECAFISAVLVFLDTLEQVRPELASRLQAQLLADKDLGLRATAARCPGCHAGAGELCDLRCYDAT